MGVRSQPAGVTRRRGCAPSVCRVFEGPYSWRQFLGVIKAVSRDRRRGAVFNGNGCDQFVVGFDVALFVPKRRVTDGRLQIERSSRWKITENKAESEPCAETCGDDVTVRREVSLARAGLPGTELEGANFDYLGRNSISRGGAGRQDEGDCERKKDDWSSSSEVRVHNLRSAGPRRLLPRVRRPLLKHLQHLSWNELNDKLSDSTASLPQCRNRSASVSARWRATITAWRVERTTSCMKR